MKLNNCFIKKEFLFDNLFHKGFINSRNTYCSFAIASNQQFFALKKLGSYDNDFDSILVFNRNLEIISSFFCGNGGEQGLVFWPDNQHILTGGFSQNHIEKERDLIDGLKLFHIFSPDKYLNPLLEFDINETKSINCKVQISSFDGQYILISNQNQILIDTVNHKYQKVNYSYPPIAFSENNKYLITSMNRRNGGSFNIYDAKNSELFKSGFGFLGYNSANNTFYTEELFSNQWGFCEQTFEGKVVRQISYSPVGTATNVSQDNQWMAFGLENGSLYVINMSDPSQNFMYKETTKSSRFFSEYPREVFFFYNSRLVIAHYWGIGLRIFEF